MLNHKKARVAPVTTAQKAVRRKRPFMKAIAPKEAKAMTLSPPASPSSPSVMLTALAVDTITSIKSGMYQAPMK